MLVVRWGPHSVDRFACNYNTKLAHFNSRFYQPGTKAVDTFTQDWKYDNNWLVPPVSLIVKVINHLKLCKAEGSIVVPVWKSSYFWTVLSQDGRHWSPFVLERLVPSNVMITLYKAYVLPNFEYCSPLLLGISRTLNNKLERANHYH